LAYWGIFGNKKNRDDVLNGAKLQKKLMSL